MSDRAQVRASTLSPPNDRVLRVASAVIATVGLALAAYLTIEHYGGDTPACFAGGSCGRVQNSEYADFLGIPVALLGLIGYASILAALAVPGENGRLGAAALSLVGFGFSAYLTYIELFVLDAVCEWCVTSAVLMTILAVLAVVRMLQAPPDG